MNELDIATEEARMRAETAADREEYETRVGEAPSLPGWKLRPIGQEQYDAIGDVILERIRQDEKWGEQNHPEAMWLAILSEEFGEVAKAMLDADFVSVRSELAQVAAVCVAWLEMYLRQAEKDREFSENFAEMEALRAELEQAEVTDEI